MSAAHRACRMMTAICIAFLTACGSVGHQGSWIEGVKTNEMDILVAEIVGVIKDAHPDTDATIIALRRPMQDHAMTVALRHALQTGGYTLADADPAPPEAIPLRVRVTPLSTGVLLRVDVGTTSASRTYARTLAGLTPASALTVRLD